MWIEEGVQVDGGGGGVSAYGSRRGGEERGRKALKGQKCRSSLRQPTVGLGGPGPICDQGLRAEFSSSCLGIRKTNSDPPTPDWWQNREGGRSCEKPGERPPNDTSYTHSIGKNQAT